MLLTAENRGAAAAPRSARPTGSPARCSQTLSYVCTIPQYQDYWEAGTYKNAVFCHLTVSALRLFANSQIFHSYPLYKLERLYYDISVSTRGE